MGWKVQVVYHLAALGFFSFVSYRIQIDKRISPDPVVRNMQRFSLRFLTNWTFTMQMLYFALSVLGHIIGICSSSLKNKMNKFTSFLAISITAPMSLVVSIAFWSIYSIDRELVFPKALDDVLPPFINHSIHTFNCLLALGDVFIVRYHYPASYKKPILALIAYLLAYSVCLFGTYFMEGVWLYPFLAKLTPPHIGLTMIGVLAIALISLFFVSLLHRLVWGKDLENVLKEKRYKREVVEMQSPYK